MIYSLLVVESSCADSFSVRSVPPPSGERDFVCGALTHSYK